MTTPSRQVWWETRRVFPRVPETLNVVDRSWILDPVDPGRDSLVGGKSLLVEPKVRRSDSLGPDLPHHLHTQQWHRPETDLDDRTQSGGGGPADEVDHTSPSVGLGRRLEGHPLRLLITLVQRII